MKVKSWIRIRIKVVSRGRRTNLRICGSEYHGCNMESKIFYFQAKKNVMRGTLFSEKIPTKVSCLRAWRLRSVSWDARADWPRGPEWLRPEGHKEQRNSTPIRYFLIKPHLVFFSNIPCQFQPSKLNIFFLDGKRKVVSRPFTSREKHRSF